MLSSVTSAAGQRGSEHLTRQIGSSLPIARGAHTESDHQRQMPTIEHGKRIRIARRGRCQESFVIHP